ncbi:MAG: hypothetical protein HN929_02440 [Chloroflexi bacterium]|jgi:hypothetical protein|nr:hypothetical protein [Chloroflexota bacterium]MBT7080319.1 hypothetical protein [Chloroflexota bacterium]MBT7289382.1 hypothetical protein [Chloroflexota bacterium]
MSCYFRHMKDVLSEAGIEVTPQNKKQIDQAFHRMANVDYENCSPTWKKLKADFISDPSKKQAMIIKLKDALS